MYQDQKKLKTRGETNRGFIKIIFILVIVLIIANFLGLTPDALWDDFIFPIIKLIWDAAVWIANLVFLLIKVAIDIIQLGIEMMKRVAG